MLAALLMLQANADTSDDESSPAIAPEAPWAPLRQWAPDPLPWRTFQYVSLGNGMEYHHISHISPIYHIYSETITPHFSKNDSDVYINHSGSWAWVL